MYAVYVKLLRSKMHYVVKGVQHTSYISIQDTESGNCQLLALISRPKCLFEPFKIKTYAVSMGHN